MRIEIAALKRPGVRMDGRELRRLKVMAGIAPVGSIIAGSVLAASLRDAGAFPFTVAFVMLSLLVAANSPLKRPLAGLGYTVLFYLAFMAEIVLGIVGILGTAGIAYLAVGVAASWAVISTTRSSLRSARGDAGEWPPPPPMPPPGPSSGPLPPPPPVLPKAPSQN